MAWRASGDWLEMDMSIDLDLSAAPLSSCPCSVRPFGDLTLRASPAAGVDWEIPMSDWRAAASSWAPVDCVGVLGEAIQLPRADGAEAGDEERRRRRREQGSFSAEGNRR